MRQIADSSARQVRAVWASMARRVQARASKRRFAGQETAGQESCRARELQGKRATGQWEQVNESKQVQLAGQENCRPVGASEVGRKQAADDTV